MTIEFIEGDLFSHAGLEAICHGCNAQGFMGAGIAAEFSKRYPIMFRAYELLCKKKEPDNLQLGDCFVYKHGDGKFVFNLITQKYLGADARYDAIETSVINMLNEAIERKIKTIGVPAIGCGIGGLEWKKVKDILINLAEKQKNVHLIVFEKFKKES